MSETAEQRSRTMRAVKSANTTPEMVVRRTLHSLGVRFRLHRSDLPGKPDLVLPGRHQVFFVHGCFWHGHDCARGARVPKTNTHYWIDKIARNKVRDERNIDALRNNGWRVDVIWECETRDRNKLRDRLRSLLLSETSAVPEKRA